MRQRLSFKALRRLFAACLAFCLSGYSGLVRPSDVQSAVLPQDNESSVNWYQWYRELRSYLRTNGGILCAPNTAIYFTRQGSIFTDSEDPGCELSLENLSFPLPRYSSVTQLVLLVPAHHKALSRHALQERINQQLPHASRPAPVRPAAIQRTSITAR